jgi:hypothetical protein
MAKTVDKQTASDVDLKTAKRVMNMLARAEDEAATENEKRIAREKAEELMAQNGLTRSDLENLDFEYREIKLRYKQQPGWQQVFANGLRKLFGVFTVYVSGSRRYGDKRAILKSTGRPSDLDQFEYLLNSITDQIYDLCEEWKEDHYVTRRRTRDFRMGAARRVRDRLYDLVQKTTERQQAERQQENRPENERVASGEPARGETDLVLLKEEEVKRKKKRAKDVMADHTSWHSRSGTSYRHSSASRDGQSAGDDVRLNKSMSSNSSHQLTE